MADPALANKSDASQSVKQMAYELFQAALFDGELKSGQLVSQKDLVKLLNLSIGALRELLPRLEAEGLVTVVPQRGIQITAIDLPMIRDAFQMRAALEREAVLHAVKTLPDSVLDEQRKLHLDIVEAVEKGVTEEVLQRGQQIDTDFHNVLIRQTNNEILIHSYNINSIRIRLIRHDRISLTELLLPHTFTDHLAIIDAIAKRDPVAAIEAMDIHISHARQRATEI
ncbi:GntR family transcriptional regulator [uncultured Cohaesibacter sp.]|uniref:GntR family transcriptional regulator n=1 Tax=uncultured Cohaesibacter sp. TaxID=1002546 RepID=UPI00292D4D17|nr:GntR family transcriptional regulator [uncultured Cohaesibacter sp.]